MSKIRIAVAGCGSVSRHYLSDRRSSEHAQVVAVCDVREERARERAEQFGVPADRVFHFISEDSQRCQPVGRPSESLLPLAGWHSLAGAVQRTDRFPSPLRQMPPCILTKLEVL